MKIILFLGNCWLLYCLYKHPNGGLWGFAIYSGVSIISLGVVVVVIPTLLSEAAIKKWREAKKAVRGAGGTPAATGGTVTSASTFSFFSGLPRWGVELGNLFFNIADFLHERG